MNKITEDFDQSQHYLAQQICMHFMRTVQLIYEHNERSEDSSESSSSEESESASGSLASGSDSHDQAPRNNSPEVETVAMLLQHRVEVFTCKRLVRCFEDEVTGNKYTLPVTLSLLGIKELNLLLGVRMTVYDPQICAESGIFF